MKKGGAQHYMRDKNKRAWENNVTCPLRHRPRYTIPWQSGRDIDDATLDPFCTHELFVGHVPLPFFSMPMWPCTWNDNVKGKPGVCYMDEKHAERFSSLFCVECKQFITVGQIVLYIISGFRLSAPNVPVISTDVRLLCLHCMKTPLSQLSYIPYVISVQFGAQLEQFKKEVLMQEHIFTRRKYACIACDSTNGSRVIINDNRRRMILCHREACVHTFSAMFHTRPLYFSGYPYTSAKQRVRELLLQLVRDQTDDANIIRRARWVYCTTCHAPITTRDFLECGKCQCALFCTLKCAKKGLEAHQKWCKPWRSWFDASQLVVLYMRSISLAQTVSVMADLTRRIDTLILQKRKEDEG